jgi:hypothetical protein
LNKTATCDNMLKQRRCDIEEYALIHNCPSFLDIKILGICIL